MTWVVTPRCNGCRYTDCVSVCPTDCFYEVTGEHRMVVIDPDSCVDCSLCETSCPVHAIYRDTEVPEVYAEWVLKNELLVKQGVHLTVKKDPLPGALTLEQVQESERARGWVVPEPPSDR